MLPYNSLLNDSWFNRQIQTIGERANKSIRATRSEANDPFWRARQAQDVGDLGAQRADEYRQRMEQMLANAGRLNAAKQHQYSSIMPKSQTPVNVIGGSYGVPEVQEPTMPEPAPMTAIPATVRTPNMPNMQPRSALPSSPVYNYNPAQFNKRRRWDAQIKPIPVY